MCIGRMGTGNADFLLLVMHILGLLNSGVKAKILCMSICKIQKGMEMKKLSIWVIATALFVLLIVEQTRL